MGLVVIISGFFVGSALLESAAPVDFRIEIHDDGACLTGTGCHFSPASLDVPEDSKVEWTNRGSLPHRISSAGDGPNSPEIAPGESWSYIFERGGTFDYSSNHPGMTGQVHVT